MLSGGRPILRQSLRDLGAGPGRKGQVAGRSWRSEPSEPVEAFARTEVEG